MSAQGTKGAPTRESLNACIILSVVAPSKGPFHTYRHLLLAFLQFVWEAADGFHCFNKKLNWRGNADWRQIPVTLPNLCSASPDWQPLPQFALWAGGREMWEPKACSHCGTNQIFLLTLSFASTTMFIPSHLTQRMFFKSKWIIHFKGKNCQYFSLKH